MVGLLMGEDFTGALKGSWQGVKVGIVQYEPWAPAPFVVEPVDEFTAQVVCLPTLVTVCSRLICA